MVQNLQAHYFIFTPNNEIESQGSATVNDKSYEYELTSDSPMDSLHKNDLMMWHMNPRTLNMLKTIIRFRRY